MDHEVESQEVHAVSGEQAVLNLVMHVGHSPFVAFPHVFPGSISGVAKDRGQGVNGS